MEISQSGNIRLLGGSWRQNHLAWEDIVSKNARASGSLEFLNVKKELRKLNLLRADYLVVKSALTKLNFVVDSETIELLKKRGYNIATTSASAYRQSLLAATNASNNILSKIAQKQKAIERSISNKDVQAPTFQELIASLSIALGFSVSEDVKLAWFNESKKIIKKRNDGQRRRN